MIFMRYEFAGIILACFSSARLDLAIRIKLMLFWSSTV